MNKSLSLLLAGIAAYGYYKYSKMSDTEKKNFINSLKEKGKKVFDQYVPSDVQNKFGKIS